MLHKKRKPSTFTPSSGFADCKRNATSNNNMLHSKSTYFYRWFGSLRTRTYLVPTMCGLALLLGLGIIVNPAAGKIETVHAAESSSDKCMNGEASSTGQCPMELSLTMSGANGTGAYEEAGATQLEVGKTAYRSYGFKVSATDIDKDGYKLYATAVETKLGEIDLTNQLVNADYPDKETFIPISTTEGVLGESITAGQWGYAIAGGGVDSILPTVDTANTNPGSLTYKAVPTNQTTPIATGTETTTTDSGIPDNPATVPDEYRLIFGAKANEGMASGHYRTQVLLSLVASPKKIAKGGFGGVTKMSEFTSAICKSLPTPATNAAVANIPTGQLIDDREGDNGTKYWVAKLADGNCWMTQNMMYDTGAKSTAYKNKIVDPAGTTATNIGSRTPSDDAATTAVYPTADTYNAHYQIGNYYNFSNAATVCTSLGGNWNLPTSNSNNNGTFGYLIATKYGIQNSSGQWTKVKAAPLFFVAGGYDGNNVGAVGRYWSSTGGGSYYYRLDFTSDIVDPSYHGSGNSHGISVRCVVSGA